MSCLRKVVRTGGEIHPPAGIKFAAVRSDEVAVPEAGSRR